MKRFSTSVNLGKVFLQDWGGIKERSLVCCSRNLTTRHTSEALVHLKRSVHLSFISSGYGKCLNRCLIAISSSYLCLSPPFRYSPSMKSLGNKFMHLTNYSVNKKNAEYQANADETACQGHKWYRGSVSVNGNLEEHRVLGFGEVQGDDEWKINVRPKIFKHLAIQNWSLCIQAQLCLNSKHQKKR